LSRLLRQVAEGNGLVKGKGLRRQVFQVLTADSSQAWEEVEVLLPQVPEAQKYLVGYREAAFLDIQMNRANAVAIGCDEGVACAPLLLQIN